MRGRDCGRLFMSHDNYAQLWQLLSYLTFSLYQGYHAKVKQYALAR